MNGLQTSSRILRHLVFVGVFGTATAFAAFHLRDQLGPFFMTRPSINGVILGLGLMGFLICVTELVRLYRQAKEMSGLADSLAVGFPDFPDEAVNRVRGGIVKDRVARTLALIRRGAAHTEALGLISDADVDSEESRGAFVRYVLGVMVFLGLIGTFWGVLITVESVQKVLEALEPSRVDDPVGFVTQLKSSMGGLLGGLSTAFSTSLFGLTGSVLLGFVDLQTRRARSELLSDLDRFVVSVLAPAASENLSSDPATRPPVMSIIRGSQDDHIYHHASQETLGENLRRLTEVIGQQSAMDERITDSIVEVKGMIEALREQDAQAREAAQSAHLTRQSLLERMDNLGRHMERLVKEVRLAREASDDMGRAVLDRMKLEGEITNKTLSLGFSDLIRSVDRLQERPRTRSDAEREDRS